MNNKTTIKTFDAVALKRELQKSAEEKLANLSDAEQIEFLNSNYSLVGKQTERKPSIVQVAELEE